MVVFAQPTSSRVIEKKYYEGTHEKAANAHGASAVKKSP